MSTEFLKSQFRPSDGKMTYAISRDVLVDVSDNLNKAEIALENVLPIVQSTKEHAALHALFTDWLASIKKSRADLSRDRFDT